MVEGVEHLRQAEGVFGQHRELQRPHHLLDDLVTTAPPKDREVEAAKARERAALRYAR